MAQGPGELLDVLLFTTLPLVYGGLQLGHVLRRIRRSLPTTPLHPEAHADVGA